MTEAQNAILSKISYLDMPPGVKPPVSIMDLIKHWSESGSPPEGYEQAFNAIRNDPDGLGSLEITAYDNQPLDGFAAYGFTKNGETVVAFRGSESIGDTFQTWDATTDWAGENLSGFVLPLTAQQMAALMFMNQNPPMGVGGNTNIDVTGHSLGGRLAQTVAILDENVSDCTSFNAPGFSGAFITFFALLIAKRRGKINDLATSNDIASTGATWFILPRAKLFPTVIAPGDHDLDNFIEYYNDHGDYRGRASGGGGGGAFGGGGGGGSRGSSGSGILKVTPAVLISTANAFRDSGDRVAKLTSEILTSSIQLRTIWDGETLRTYTFKLGKLNDDAQRMCGMINEHVIDLHEMAERYSVAENQNISLSNALAEEVIF